MEPTLLHGGGKTEYAKRFFFFCAFSSYCLLSFCFFPFPVFYAFTPRQELSLSRSLYLVHFLPFSASLHLFYSSGVRCLFRLIDIIILKNMKLYIAHKKIQHKEQQQEKQQQQQHKRGELEKAVKGTKQRRVPATPPHLPPHTVAL